MKSVTTKILTSIALATLLFSFLLFYQTYSLTYRLVTEVLDQQASMALQFDLSIRKYIAHHVRPLMYELMGDEEFIPETMSTSFVARAIFEDVRKEFPGYILKFSSDNPRNHSNQAGIEELNIIEHFNKNPRLKIWTGEIVIDEKPYMAKFSARRMEASCLRCHGDPVDAPANLLKRYGSNAGFHRPLGEIIGLDTVAIPIDKFNKKLWSASIRPFIASGLGLLLFFLAIALIIRVLISKRLTRIAHHFVHASNQANCSRIKSIEMKGRDEIGDLSSSFNTLSGKLNHFYSSLETEVREQTKELLKTNEHLREEIDDRQKAEKSLRESQKNLQVLFKTLNDFLFILDTGSRILHFNPVVKRRLGYAEEELYGKPIGKLFPSDRRHEAADMINEVLAGKRSMYTIPLMADDGTQIPVETNFTKGEWDGKDVLFGISRDIGDRKQAEEALQKSEQRFREMAGLLPTIICELDDNMRVTYINNIGLDIFGFSESDIESGIYGWDIFHPLDKEKATKCFERLLHGEEMGSTEYRLKRRDGSEIVALVYASTIQNNGIFQGIRISVTDITERKRFEAQLQHSQKTEAIGTLAGGIAHNFNNLLMGIQGYTSLMLLDTNPSHPNYERLNSIQKQIQGGSRLTSQLLGYASKGKYEVTPISLNQLVSETSDTFGMTRKEIRIHTELCESQYGIKADQGQIELALLNLYINAAEAMPGGGDLFLKTRNVSHDDMQGKPYDVKPGNYVSLTIRDTGIGMDEEIKGRIFEPFFTTKGWGEGTGLGLASVYGIIKAHGGYIDVNSSKGCGTTFEIYLPATGDMKPMKKYIPSKLVKGEETVLFVDDEDMVLNAVRPMMERMGYDVIVASSGEEALSVYEKHSDKIDLVILDMVMPDMGGGDTFDRLRTIDDNVKILLSSGYSIDGEAEEILERGCNGFMQKPFNMNELSGKLRTILDSPYPG